MAPHVNMPYSLSWNRGEPASIGERVRSDFENSLQTVGVGYFDLLLMHWPGDFGSTDGVLGRRARAEIWTVFEAILLRNQARAIGVSNFTIKHLTELFEDCQIRPMVNQIEVHPYCLDLPLISFCKSNGIVVQSYSPLASGQFGLLSDSIIASIAARVGRTIAQVILRWHVQHGLVPLPKATEEVHMRENRAVFDFELSDGDMAAINGLHVESSAAKRTCPDPYTIA